MSRLFGPRIRWVGRLRRFRCRRFAPDTAAAGHRRRRGRVTLAQERTIRQGASFERRSSSSSRTVGTAPSQRSIRWFASSRSTLGLRSESRLINGKVCRCRDMNISYSSKIFKISSSIMPLILLGGLYFHAAVFCFPIRLCIHMVHRGSYRKFYKRERRLEIVISRSSKLRRMRFMKIFHTFKKKVRITEPSVAIQDQVKSIIFTLCALALIPRLISSNLRHLGSL